MPSGSVRQHDTPSLGTTQEECLLKVTCLLSRGPFAFKARWLNTQSPQGWTWSLESYICHRNHSLLRGNAGHCWCCGHPFQLCCLYMSSVFLSAPGGLFFICPGYTSVSWTLAFSERELVFVSVDAYQVCRAEGERVWGPRPPIFLRTFLTQ